MLSGRGEIRLKVFLTTLMMATKAPHRTSYTWHRMALMLDLRDPMTAGRRRIQKAISDLEGIEFIRRMEKKGLTPEVQILKPDGSGKEDWSDKDGSLYIGIPISLWRNGWFQSLSGSALGLLIILLDQRRKNQKGVWLDGISKSHYGFSPDFWTKASKELIEAKLLSVSRQTIESYGEPRRRNIYTLHLERLDTHYPSGDPLKDPD